MNLLYDLTATQPSPESKFHGGGAYGEVLFFKLVELIYEKKLYPNVKMICYFDKMSYLNPAILKACEINKIALIDINEKSVRQIFQKFKITRLYSAMLNLNQNLPLGEIEIFTTVHGLRTLEMPFDKIMLSYANSLKEKIKFHLFMGIAKNYYLKKLKIINGRLVTDKRINVITISRHSLASINSFYPETKNKKIPIFASPNFDSLGNYAKYNKENLPGTSSEKKSANQPDDKNSDGIFKDFGIQKDKYFLITSAARWAKNALRAVWAFDSFFQDSPESEFKVVVTGTTNQKIFTKNLKNPNHFVFLDYVGRRELLELTKNQYAFVYPSLNEGFGYPPLEAMQFGKPVAASGTSSIPEVLGDAAVYFDPYSVSEIKNRIIQLLDRNIYDEYSQKSLKRYEIMSKKQKDDLQKLAEYVLKM